MKPALPYHLYGDYPQPCLRLNHNMVERGVHSVPTLRNHVVFFFILKGNLDMLVL